MLNDVIVSDQISWPIDSDRSSFTLSFCMAYPMSVSRVMTQSPWQQPDLQQCTIVSCLHRGLCQPNQNSPCYERWFSLTGDPVCLDRHMRLRYDCRGRSSCYRTYQPLFLSPFPAKKSIIISLNSESWGTLILLLKTSACFCFEHNSHVFGNHKKTYYSCQFCK